MSLAGGDGGIGPSEGAGPLHPAGQGDAPTTIGTTVLLYMYLEDALKAVDRIERQRVPYAAKKASLALVMERLYAQLEPERLSLLSE